MSRPGLRLPPTGSKTLRWAVWKALIMITNEPPEQRALARHVLDELATGA